MSAAEVPVAELPDTRNYPKVAVHGVIDLRSDDLDVRESRAHVVDTLPGSDERAEHDVARLAPLREQHL